MPMTSMLKNKYSYKVYNESQYRNWKKSLMMHIRGLQCPLGKIKNKRKKQSCFYSLITLLRGAEKGSTKVLGHRSTPIQTGIQKDIIKNYSGLPISEMVHRLILIV